MQSNLMLTKRAWHKAIQFCLLAVIVLSSLTQPVSAIDEFFYSGNDVIYYNPDMNDCIVAENSGDTFMPDGSGVNVDKNFSLGTAKGKRPVNLVAQLVKDFGFKDFQAAGIVGNFMHESGGVHLPPNINEGMKAGPPRFSGGYGWAQWTGGRQTNFIDYAVKNGYMKNASVSANDAANYAYLVYEITKTAEKKAVPAVKKTKSVVEASRAWEEVFERAGVVANASRDKHSKDVLQAFKSNGNVGGASGSVESTDDDPLAEECVSEDEAFTGSSNSTDFGPIAFPLQGTQKTVKNASSIFKKETTIGGHDYPNAYDIYAPAGTKVVAFASGTVTRISTDKCGSRLVGVWNKKANTVVTYMHMKSSPHAKQGTSVSPGDFIGTVASVGAYPCVNVDHLHIDAMKGMKIRGPCQRGSCSEPYRSKLIDIGPDLYKTYKALPK